MAGVTALARGELVVAAPAATPAWDVLHLPAPVRLQSSGFGPRREPLEKGLARMPDSWPTACGLEGLLYVNDGLLLWSNIPPCPDCYRGLDA